MLATLIAVVSVIVIMVVLVIVSVRKHGKIALSGHFVSYYLCKGFRCGSIIG